MVAWLIMGNCFGLKRKKKCVREDHPTVRRWLDDCDFSSVPDNIDEISMGPSENCVIIDSILGGKFPEGDCDGYTTALENLESEDESCGDVIGAQPSSSIGSHNRSGSSTFIHEESIYETSDELLRNEVETVPEAAMLPATFSIKNSELSFEHDESDILEELVEWESNYDARPIRPLPTPLRKNLISPRINLEKLVDGKGRVRRTERVKLYLDQIRQASQHLQS